MKKGQLFILLILCLIVGGAGWYLKKNSQQAWEEQDSGIGQLLFSDFPLNDITRLTVSAKKESVELVKESDHWTVKSAHSYYADFSKIADFLKTISDLKILQKVEIEENDLGRLELNEPDADADTGIKVEFFNKKDTSIGKLLLGKQHMRKTEGSAGQFGGGGGYPDGRYIFQPKTKVVALVSETFSNITGDSSSWLDKSFIKVDKIKRATVKQGEGIIWTVYREKEDDSLALEGDIEENREVDQSKLSGIDSSFRYANFNKIADPTTPEEELGFSEGRLYTAETFDGFVYAINIGKKAEDGEYPIKISINYNEPQPPASLADEPEEEKVKKEEEFAKQLTENKEKFEKESKRYSKWVFMVASHTIDDLLLNREELTKEKEKKEDQDEKTTAVGEGASDDPVKFPENDIIPNEETNIPEYGVDLVEEATEIEATTDNGVEDPVIPILENDVSTSQTQKRDEGSNSTSAGEVQIQNKKPTTLVPEEE